MCSFVESLKKIKEFSNEVDFFIENIDKLQAEDNEMYYEYYYSNSIGIEVDKSNPYEFRIFDPFNQISNSYKNTNGWTEWSE